MSFLGMAILGVPLPLGGSHERLTDTELDTAHSLTPPASASVMLISAETQGIRVTVDGTTVTSTVGHAVAAGADFVTMVDPDIPVQIIRQAAGAVAQVTFYA